MVGRSVEIKMLVRVILVCLAAGVLLPGCGLVLFGRTEGIYVDSDPPGADITLNGTVRGTTPCKIRIHRQRDIDLEKWSRLQEVRFEEGRARYREEKRRLGRRPYSLLLTKDGYVPRVEHLRSGTRCHRFFMMSLLYMMYFPMLGMQADFEAGVMDSVLPKIIYAKLEQLSMLSQEGSLAPWPGSMESSTPSYVPAPATDTTVPRSSSEKGIGTYVLHLEDGSRVQGTLMDHKPGKGYMVRRLDGTTVVFPEEDVVRLERTRP